MNMPARTGTVVEFLGWPDLLHMEPTNEPARRIYKFQKAHQFDSAKPPVPHDPIGGAIYLPVLVDGYREGKNATPEMPRYIARNRNVDLRSRVIPVGMEFAWVSWPIFGIEASQRTSGTCRRISRCANREHPRLPISPWNDFDDTLWLPDLPERKKGPGTIRDLDPLAVPSHEEFRRGRLINAPAAIPATSPTRSATRRRVSA